MSPARFRCATELDVVHVYSPGLENNYSPSCVSNPSFTLHYPFLYLPSASLPQISGSGIPNTHPSHHAPTLHVPKRCGNHLAASSTSSGVPRSSTSTQQPRARATCAPMVKDVHWLVPASSAVSSARVSYGSTGVLAAAAAAAALS
jgi:hypothetical protein